MLCRSQPPQTQQSPWHAFLSNFVFSGFKLKLTLMEVFIPQKLANATKQGFPLPHETQSLNTYQHLRSHQRGSRHPSLLVSLVLMIFANQEVIKIGAFYFRLHLTIRRLSRRRFKHTGQTEIQTLAPSLICCVTLGKQCNLSVSSVKRDIDTHLMGLLCLLKTIIHVDCSARCIIRTPIYINAIECCFR